jgi:hypothetical protein
VDTHPTVGVGFTVPPPSVYFARVMVLKVANRENLDSVDQLPQVGAKAHPQFDIVCLSECIPKRFQVSLPSFERFHAVLGSGDLLLAMAYRRFKLRLSFAQCPHFGFVSVADGPVGRARDLVNQVVDLLLNAFELRAVALKPLPQRTAQFNSLLGTRQNHFWPQRRAVFQH